MSYEADGQRSEQPLSLAHPEYSPAFFARIELIIKYQAELEALPSLNNSPILEACHAILEHRASAADESIIGTETAKARFPQIWDHYIALLRSDSHPNALAFLREGLTFLEAIGVNGRRKISSLFDVMLKKEDRQARRNEVYGQNGIARIGGVHKELVLVPTPERNRDPHEHLELLKIAAAQQFVQYLLNQKDYAGYSHDPIPLPDKEYVERTSTTARSILEHLRDNDTAWEQFTDTEQSGKDLAAILKKHVIIPADLDQKLPYGTHDYNLIRDDKTGEEKFIDPKIVFQNTDGRVQIEASHYGLHMLSVSGEKYKPTTLQDFLSTSTIDIYTDMKKATGSSWKKFPDVKNLSTLPHAHLAISFSEPAKPGEWKHRMGIFSHRGGHGRINTHIHQDFTDKKTPDYFYYFGSHLYKDGQANNADADNGARALGVTKRMYIDEGITINPSYPDTDPRTDKEQAELEAALGLSDVEIVFTLDAETLQRVDENLQVLNNHLIKPISYQIETILGKSPDTTEIIRLLNPRLSRHTLLGLLMEKYGPTANCVFPLQTYERLGFSIFPDITTAIDEFMNQATRIEPNSLHDTDSFQTIAEAVRLALTDQALTRLGFSPLGALGVYTSGEILGVQLKAVAKKVAQAQAPETNAGTDILFQISELGPKSLASLFTSANSRFNDRTTNAISLQGDTICFRLNLNDPTVRKALHLDIPSTRTLLRDKKLLAQYQESLPKAAQALLRGRVNMLPLLAEKLAAAYRGSVPSTNEEPSI
jgi:hypothetical protein